MKKQTAQSKQPAVKQIQPKTGETKYLGNEPLWNEQPSAENRNNKINWAFSWYNYYCNGKDARKFTVDWLSRNEKHSKLSQAFSKVSDRDFPTTLGWVCRMSLMGLVLTKEEEQWAISRIKTLIEENNVVATKDSETKKPERPNIQDYMRAKMLEAGGEIEYLFDQFIESGCKLDTSQRAINILRERNIAAQMVGEVTSSWQKVKRELEDVIGGKDADLVEGYSRYSKINLRNMLKFVDQVIADCGNYVQVKKVERKPRKKKAVSPEKLTAKFRYQREDTDLKLKSQAVTDLVNAQEAWLYDTKKRKLIHVVADEMAKTFTVKGTSIIGFDTAASMQKTLRKPKEQLKSLMSVGAPAARKIFKEIRATETKFNGRSNENIILLRIR